MSLRGPFFAVWLGVALLCGCPPADDPTSDSVTDSVADDVTPTNDSGTQPDDLEPVTQAVGLDGGRIEAARGMELVIPPGAVETEVQITVTPLAFAPGDLLDRTVFELTPPGLHFRQPVTVSFPYRPADVEGAEAELGVAMTFGPKSLLEHVASQADPDNDRVIAHLTRFPSSPSTSRGGGGSIGVACCVPLTPPSGVTADLAPAESGVARHVEVGWVDPGWSYVRVERAVVIGGDPCTCHGSRPACVDPAGSRTCADGAPGVWTGLQSPMDCQCGEPGTACQGRTTECWTSVTGALARDGGWSDFGIGSQAGVFHYRLRSMDSAGNLSHPSPDTARVVVFGSPTAPLAPAFVSATPLTCGGVRLSWTSCTGASPCGSADFSTATAYRIEQAQVGGLWEHVADVSANQLEWTARGLEPGVSYVFRVAGLNTSTATGREQRGGSAVSGAVVNADAEFDLAVAPSRLSIVPGVDREQRARAVVTSQVPSLPDVTLRFETADGLGESLLDVTTPLPTTYEGTFSFGFDPATPIGRSVVGRIVGTTSTPTTCDDRIVLRATDPMPNPAPRLTALDPWVFAPDTATAQELVVTGADFLPSTVVRLEGASRATTFVSDTELRVTLPATDLVFDASDPYHTITATTPSPGGGTSNFLILAIGNPVPQVDTITPQWVAANGMPDFTVTLTGQDFMPDSVVRFEGQDRSTTFVSSTELEAFFFGADVNGGGYRSYSITVVTPEPGGGTSSEVLLYTD